MLSSHLFGSTYLVGLLRESSLLISLSSTYDGMLADKACDYSGFSSFTLVAVEYTLAVVLHILWVDRDDKRDWIH
jgi:hypothetical protein